MPRDGTGQYTLPLPPVFPGDIIESNWANTTLNDLALAMTDSLSRTGAGGLLVPFQVADGTVGAPGLAFANEPTSGLYRAGMNDIRFATAGADKLRITDVSISVLATRLLIPDGTLGLPSIAFTSEPTSGIYKQSSNTWALVNGGTEALRLTFTSVQLFKPLYIIDGTAAAPAIGFYNEQNLGLFRPQSGMVSVATEGVERVRIQSTALSIFGTSFRLANESAPSANRYFRINSVANGFMLGALDSSETTYREYIRFDSSEGVVRSAAPLGFRVMDPALMADVFRTVNGATDFSTPIGGVDQKHFRIGYVSGNWYVGTLDDAKSTFKNFAVFSNTEQVLHSYCSNGFVVNTGSIAAIFAARTAHVEINSTLRMPNATAIQLKTTGGLDWNLVFANTSNAIVIGGNWPNIHVYSNTFERLRITQNGSVKMTNANAFFDAGANFHEMYSNAASYACLFTNSNPTNPFGLQSFFSGFPPGARPAGNYHLLCQDAVGSVLMVYANGGIANFQANNVNLCDERAKLDIAPSTDYTDFVERLVFHSFRYENTEETDRTDDVTAQEVEAIAPELVVPFGDTGMKAVLSHRLQNRINSIIPRLVQRMKQLNARVKALEDART